VPAPTVMGRFDDVVWDVDISSDGETAVTAGEDGIVQLWDLGAGAASGPPLFDSERDALSVAFSADDSLVLSGNGRGEMMGWEVAGGAETFDSFNAHSSDIWEIVFSPNGESVATASSDGHIRLWDLSLQLLAEPFAGETEDVRGVQFLHDGDLLAAGDENGQVRVWDIGSNREVQVTGVGHGAQVLASSLDADGTNLVTLGLDQRLIPWLVPARGASSFVGQEEGAFGLAVSPDGARLAVGDGSGSVRIFSTETGEMMLGPVGVGSDAVWGLAFTTDGERLVSGSADGSLAVIDAASGEVTHSAASAHDGAVRSIVVSEDFVLSGGDDEVVRGWTESLAPIGDDMGSHLGGVTDMALSGDGVLAVSDRSGSVHFWDPEQASPAGDPLSAEDNAIWGVAWSPEGDRLATASDDWAAYVWDVATHDLIAKLTSLPQGGTGVAFLGGETIATTSRDGSVRLFDVMLQREIGSVLGSHADAAWRMAVFPHSLRFATSGQDGSVAVWDALDLERACARSAGALDDENQRRFLGGEGEALGCR
jgi:WD40 repeat protein